MSPQQQLIQQLAGHGITDARVLQAIGQVPRERFVLAEHLDRAWDDRALPIDAGQTISQPYMVAVMSQALQLAGDETVLEIGTGSGYQAAILAGLCRRVVTIERIPELSEQAQRVLTELRVDNVEFHIADGSLGWPAEAPYEGIIVTAGAPAMPEELYRQLKTCGRLVIPIGTEHPQMLQTIVKQDSGPQIADVCACSFVPLIGAEAWPERRP